MSDLNKVTYSENHFSFALFFWLQANQIQDLLQNGLYNITTNLKEPGHEGVDWIQLDQESAHW
jgi:hypothetical protein